MRVLVLGWEYPPLVAGGLGAACFGLTGALASRESPVTLAVPAAPGARGRVAQRHVTRVDLPLGSDAVGDPPLSPYGQPTAAVGTPGPTAGATGTGLRPDLLYGPGFQAALSRYTRAVTRRFGARPGAFDVVHAHDWMTVPAALQLRARTGVPVCMHVHSTAFDRAGVLPAPGALEVGEDPSRVLERAGVLSADLVIGVSAFTAGVLRAGYGVPERRLRVVHNAAPAREVAEPPPRDPAAPPTVLFVGRLTRQKGATFLLRAARAVLAHRPDVRFVLVGDGEERARLVEESAALGIARSVFFTGPASDEERDRAYCGATLFVLSSISEPFGLTPLEALAHGTPVLLSKRAGVTEVLPSAPTFDPWDLEGFAGAITELIDDPARREDLVQRCRADGAHRGWAESGAALREVLREAARSRGRASARSRTGGR